MAGAVDFPAVTLQTFVDRTQIAALIGYSPTNVFYVDSNNGATTNDGLTRTSALTTLALALAKCTDSKGDCVVLMPGHAETLSSTTTTIANIGVTVVGMGNARNRPTITAGAADVSAITLSGSSCQFKNIRFVSSTSQTSKASVVISITGADNILDGCTIEHGSTGSLDGIKLTAAARTVIKNCIFLGTGTAAQCAIQVKSNLRDAQISDNQFNYGINLLKSAVIFASLGSDLAGTNILRNIAVGTKIAFTDISASVIAAGATEGMIAGNRVGYGNTTTVAFLTGQAGFKTGGLACCDNWFNNAKHAHPMVPGTFLNKASVVNNNAFRFSLPT